VGKGGGGVEGDAGPRILHSGEAVPASSEQYDHPDHACASVRRGREYALCSVPWMVYSI